MLALEVRTLSRSSNSHSPFSVPGNSRLAHLAPRIAGQNVFFHLNHPIRWVRVSGIVVAVDEYPGRRIFTLDDSSGVCIECTIEVPKSDAALAAAITANTAATSQDSAVKPDSKGQALPGASRTAAPSEPPPKAVVPAEVDVGTVIDVKGGLALFRGQKQIKILKATVLRCTEHEVAFWEKVAQFRRDVLEKPWQLTDKEVRRCRKDEERRK